MERFIHNENNRRYRVRLEEEADEEKRKIIQIISRGRGQNDLTKPGRRDGAN